MAANISHSFAGTVLDDEAERGWTDFTGDQSATVTLSSLFTIPVSNNLGGIDQFGALAQNVGKSRSFTLSLDDTSQALFASDALPQSAGGLKFRDFSWSAFKYESSVGTLPGRLTSLSCAAN